MSSIPPLASGVNSTGNLDYGHEPAMNMIVRTNTGTLVVYGTHVLNQVTSDPSYNDTYTSTHDNNGNSTKRHVGSLYVHHTRDCGAVCASGRNVFPNSSTI